MLTKRIKNLFFFTSKKFRKLEISVIVIVFCHFCYTVLREFFQQVPVCFNMIHYYYGIILIRGFYHVFQKVKLVHVMQQNSLETQF